MLSRTDPALGGNNSHRQTARTVLSQGGVRPISGPTWVRPAPAPAAPGRWAPPLTLSTDTLL